MNKIFIIFLVSAHLLFAKTAIIEIPSMHCPLCTTTIKKAIMNLDAVTKAKVRLNTKEAIVEFDDEKIEIQTILDAINATTYEPILKSSE